MVNNQRLLIDRNRLKGKMAENSISKTELASYLGLSYGGLMKKISRNGLFNESEIRKLLALFGDYIFFVDGVN
jgi:hypothetical protein